MRGDRVSVVVVEAPQGTAAEVCGCCMKVKPPKLLQLFDLDLGVRVCPLCGHYLELVGADLEALPGIRAPHEEEGGMGWR